MHDAIANVLGQFGVSANSFKRVSDNVLRGTVRAGDALKLWLALREIQSHTGAWPVIGGDIGDRINPMLRDHDPAAILRAAPAGSSLEVLRERGLERVEDLQVLIGDIDSGSPSLVELARQVDESDIFDFIGSEPAGPEPWPTEPVKTSVALSTLRNSEGGRVSFFIVLNAQPFEVPAYLGFGGWNDCPQAELHVAMLREWGKTYAAVPACMTGDVVECVVDRPPQTEEDAFALAAEQWIYCDDIVSQGTGKVRHLAIEIWKSPTWFFWWD
jgi:hypothetical protein